MVICLGQGADLHVAQLVPLPLIIFCSSKSRLVLPFWYWLAYVVWTMGHYRGVVVVAVKLLLKTDETQEYLCTCNIHLP